MISQARQFFQAKQVMQGSFTLTPAQVLQAAQAFLLDKAGVAQGLAVDASQFADNALVGGFQVGDGFFFGHTELAYIQRDGLLFFTVYGAGDGHVGCANGQCERDDGLFLAIVYQFVERGGSTLPISEGLAIEGEIDAFKYGGLSGFVWT